MPALIGWPSSQHLVLLPSTSYILLSLATPLSPLVSWWSFASCAEFKTASSATCFKNRRSNNSLRFRSPTASLRACGSYALQWALTCRLLYRSTCSCLCRSTSESSSDADVCWRMLTYAADQHACVGVPAKAPPSLDSSQRSRAYDFKCICRLHTSRVFFIHSHAYITSRYVYASIPCVALYITWQFFFRLKFQIWHDFYHKQTVCVCVCVFVCV